MNNDSSRFLTSLNAAVSSSMPAFVADAALIDVLERLTGQTTQFALFLDDFESIQGASVLNLVRTLIEGLQQGNRLVIGSRGLPDIPIARLRARGQMLEIGTDSLQFSEDAKLSESRELARNHVLLE